MSPRILNQCHSQPRPLKIVHVGAGASGLLAAYKARKMLENYEFICYEKNEEVGGTWWESRYPGCACDVPAHIYSYSFEPNPEFSEFYSGSAEIQQYFQRFYTKYELQPYVRLNTEVLSAHWVEAEGKWIIELQNLDGSTFLDKCDVLINGSGVVNKPRWPAIEGQQLFTGTLVHTARWDTSLSWEGKRVAVLGVGSSAVQVLPHLSRGSKSVHVFARSPLWISPQLADDIPAASPSQSTVDTNSTTTLQSPSYSTQEKEKFRQDPELHLAHRKCLETRLARGFPIFLRGSQLNQWAIQTMRDNMLLKLGPGLDELKEKLIPTWSPGCRRLTPGEGFLEALNKPNVHLVCEGVQQMTTAGLMTASGDEYEFDVIVCATGFQISYIPHFEIYGVDGVNMREAWSENPNIYLSITCPKFPNYFVINGPTGNWGQGCVLPSLRMKHEVQIEYALQCCKKIQEDRIRALEVRQEPTSQINEYLDAWHSQYSVWAENCRSWYKNDKAAGRVFIWPGSLLHLLKTLRTPRYEHYDVRYLEDNMWSFLGNGRTVLEERDLKGETVDLAPFIRVADEEWNIE
ncbi:putative sterigmatocystin biosynthesis monooxygenase stcW [Talaromyces pinophilus]|nr:putative sterigmatocystin biosynthesis monooxygenase stcW [Talaromyces pinophilus]